MTGRIGLYGGCFNPVHLGHMAAAHGAMAALALDEIIFVPSGHPPLKGDAGLAEGAHRVAMLERAVASERGMRVSAIELDRDGPSFTVDTVRALKVTLPAASELFFLLGDDCVARLPQWKGIDELHAMLRFAILPRTGVKPSLDDARLIWLQTEPLQISSTQIRELLGSGVSPSETLLPPDVADYIGRNALYANQPEATCV